MSVTHSDCKPTCPDCGHMLTDDEMHKALSTSAGDLWALAPQEGRSEIDCPACGKHYYIQGGYRPEYTTALDEEEF